MINVCDLHKRQLLGESFRKLSSSQTFVENLDIARRLRGHTGCVNALDWSPDGRYLASGSDDKRVIIWDTHTSGSFTAKDIHTGHTRNIFSVKFVPGTNNRTLITAAGDKEIRVFDVEYGSSSGTILYEPCQRTIHRAHRDRVKRIVVEHDGHCFLSCSEDGDVRQFDTRAPETDVQRSPLISYANHQIDLNAIALNQHKPYLLALGGSHPCAFLHDRRMVGRDMLREWGAGSTTRTPTQCVKKFQSGRHAEHKYERDVITALRFGNDNPRELLGSWLNDDVYLFDIHGEVQASEKQTITTKTAPKSSVDKSTQKRKRSPTPPSSSKYRRALTFGDTSLSIFEVVQRTHEFLCTSSHDDFDPRTAYQNFLVAVELALYTTHPVDAFSIKPYTEDCRIILVGLADDAEALGIEERDESSWHSLAISFIVNNCCAPDFSEPLFEFDEKEDCPVIRQALPETEPTELFKSHKELVQTFNEHLETDEGSDRLLTEASRAFWIGLVCRALLRETTKDLQETVDFFNDREKREELYRINEISPWNSMSDDEYPESDTETETATDEIDEDFDSHTSTSDEEYAFRRTRDFQSDRNDNLVNPSVPAGLPSRSFSGHVNMETIKDVNFLGIHDEYVMSGSDDGLLFIWEKSSGKIVNMLYGDNDVTNVMEANPSCTSLAVSGIDSYIKIFEPFEDERGNYEDEQHSMRVRDSEYEVRARNRARLSNAIELQRSNPSGHLVLQLAQQHAEIQQCRQQ